MGTNYYYREEINICKCCKRRDDVEIHIGKSSSGWNFLFDNHCKTYKEWVEFVKKHDGNLYNEYGDNIPADKFINQIFEIKGERHKELAEYDGEYDISNFRDFS